MTADARAVSASGTQESIKMPNPSPANQVFGLLVRYRNWWLIPAMVGTMAAVGFALFGPQSYTSRQTLVLRDDLMGTFFKPGRFDSLDSMKSAQETILEISRRPQVIRSALEKLGPPNQYRSSEWPNEETIHSTQGKIQISAPNGAEFGRTEAIVLTVQAASRERSRAFISALLDQIETSLKDLRSRQFDSMRLELQQAVDEADAAYQDAAEKLKQLELRVGSDLSTLISLNDSQSGFNNLLAELENLNLEQRRAWADVEEVEKQIQVLMNVSDSPENLLEVPHELLQLQPTLASLAQGLNTAILQFASTKGRYQMYHPRVREEYQAVEEIKKRIKDKLGMSLTSLQHQLDLRRQKYDRVTGLINQKESRLSELSGMRVDYATCREDVAKKREIKGKAQANLAEVQALGRAAKQVNLISRVDEPLTELYPNGPSKQLIVFGGTVAGLFIGLGLVMFIAPIDQTFLAAAPAQSLPRSNMPRTTLPVLQPTPNMNRPKWTTLSNSPHDTAPSQPPVPPRATPHAANKRSQSNRGPSPVVTGSPPQSARGQMQSASSQPGATPTHKPAPATAIPKTKLPIADISVCGLQKSAIRESNMLNIPSIRVPDVTQIDMRDTVPVAPATTDNTKMDTEGNPHRLRDQAFVLELPDSASPLDSPAALSWRGCVDISDEKSWTHIDFSNSQLGPDKNLTLAEKLNQLEQLEAKRQLSLPTAGKTIPISGAEQVSLEPKNQEMVAETIVPSTDLPLTTSIPKSSTATADGCPSVPPTGVQPDTRPTATPVDLRTLKDQLAGKKLASEKLNAKKLSDLLTPIDHQSDSTDLPPLQGDIANLAQSIRQMCERRHVSDTDPQ